MHEKPSGNLLLTTKALFQFALLVLFLTIFILISTGLIYSVYPDLIDAHWIIRDENIALTIHQFNLGGENNLTSWYSSMLLLSAALLAVACIR